MGGLNDYHGDGDGAGCRRREHEDQFDPATLIFVAVMTAMNFGHGMMFGPESCYFPELFGPRVRYSGASFGFQLSAAIGGGFAPIIATALVGYFGGTSGVSLMMIALALITLAAALVLRETKGGSLTD